MINMGIMDYITTTQPTKKEMDNTPEPVRKYIRALERALIEHVMKI